MADSVSRVVMADTDDLIYWPQTWLSTEILLLQKYFAVYQKLNGDTWWLSIIYWAGSTQRNKSHKDQGYLDGLNFNDFDKSLNLGIL